MTIRVVVADDEPLGRQRLARLLQSEPDAEVVAFCADGEETVRAIQSHQPDLVLLDIQMPGLDGFEVMRTLDGAPRPPAVIFVTAHDQYAMRAFEVHACDYLLKPVEQERLHGALTRAAIPAPARAGGLGRRLLTLLEELTARERCRGHERLVIRTAERAYFLRTDAIDWVEADGKYLQLHAGRGTHVMRQSMADLEQDLDPSRFLRISRSAIVNLDRVQEVQPWFQGDYVLILADGTRLTSTRGYRDGMRRLLGKSA